MTKKNKKDQNISGEALAEGVSENDFKKLLGYINDEVKECTDSINNYEDVINDIKNKNPNVDLSPSITDFKNQVNKSNQIINDNLKKIQDLFNKIFKDWEEYKNTELNGDNKNE